MSARLLPLPVPDRRPLLGLERAVLAVSVLLVWFLAWAHPLYPPDEGRYGTVAATMAESGNWLVPEFRGNPHLTKPPLSYWLQAAGVSVFGRSEFAVRLPSLLATSLGLLFLFSFARRTLGTRPAVVATAMASVMPMLLVVGRLANTDAILSCAWIAALSCGHRALTAERPAFAAVGGFWLATALGILVKGPAGLGPLLIVGAWQLLAGRPGQLWRLQPLIGLPLACLPLGAWVVAIVVQHPAAGQLWWDETIGRVTGEKELRVEPWWFYLPIFLGGMYPATTMLTLPWFNLRWGDAWAALRLGDLRALLLVAVLFPLLGFSISTGKLATYLLPLAMPTALLTALMLERWLDGTFDRTDLPIRPPDVRRTLTVVAICVFLVQLGGAVWAATRPESQVPELWAFVVPLAIVPLATLVLWRTWSQGPPARWRGLGLVWLAMVANWTLTFGIETRYTGMMGADRMLAYAEERYGIRSSTVYLVGLLDPTVRFYNPLGAVHEVESLAELRSKPPERLPALVAIKGERLDALIMTDPAIAARLEPLGTWTRWFADPVRIYLLNEDPAAIAPLPQAEPAPPAGGP